MSILIIDSGSTKADWALIKSEEDIFYQSVGCNPAINHEWMEDILADERCVELLNQASEIYFYGAGISTVEISHSVKETFKKFVKNSNLIEVKSDIYAAIYATLGDKPGIASILGTGSNSCLFDGNEIIDQIPSLGYVFTDEGSGVAIGKEVIKSYFYKDMPLDIMQSFEEKYKLNKSTLLHKVYKSPKSNEYIASFATFLNFMDNPWKNELTQRIFKDFLQIRVKKYKEYQKFDLTFTGSIAYYFEGDLQKAAKQEGLNIKTIITRPMDGLINYHKQKSITNQ